MLTLQLPPWNSGRPRMSLKSLSEITESENAQLVLMVWILWDMGSIHTYQNINIFDNTNSHTSSTPSCSPASIFKQAQVTPLKKPTLKPLTTDSYRPDSLLQFIAKTLKEQPGHKGACSPLLTTWSLESLRDQHLDHLFSFLHLHNILRTHHTGTQLLTLHSISPRPSHRSSSHYCAPRRHLS